VPLQDRCDLSWASHWRPSGILVHNPLSLGACLSAGPSAAPKEALWQKLGKALEQLQGVAVAVWHLQRVLTKKRDPLSHVLFIDVVLEGGTELPTDHIWCVSSCVHADRAIAGLERGFGTRPASISSRFPVGSWRRIFSRLPA
jgi:hypothetical protein